MIMENKILNIIIKEKIVGIIRGVPSAYILQTIQALYDGGIRCVEIAIDHKTKESIENTYACIKLASEKFADKMLIGAGTILTVEEIKKTSSLGALYMISPNTDEAVIKETKKMGLVSMPGAMSPSEITDAYTWGADIVKVFPAGYLGTSYFKAMQGPLGHIPLMAVGGINAENLADFMKAGAVGAGIGGNLANVNWIKEGKFAEITATAKEMVAIVKA